VSTEQSPTPGGETPINDEQPVRRRRQLTVVTVAAAVLLAGGGGAYWASTAGSTDSGGKGSAGQEGTSEPPTLALDGLATAQQSGEGGDGGAGIAPGEPHGQTYLANKKLPDGPDSAAVFRSPTGVSRASVAELAKTLDVPGSPQKKDGRWVMGEDDARPGMTLTVNDDRLAGNWTFEGESSSDLPCARTLPIPGEGFTSGPGKSPDRCAGMPPSGKGGDPVSEKKAKSAVQPALKTLKLKDADLDAGVTAGPLRMVNVTPKADGMPARDWNSTFTVDGDGKVVRAHGNLGKLRKGATYPVMTAKETLEQLNKQGATGSAGAGSGTVREPAPDDVAGDDVRQGAGKLPGNAAKRKPVKVTDAEFGLVTRYTFGKPVLVPSWIYKVQLPDGVNTARVAHPAVQPEYIKPARSAQQGAGPGSGSGSDTGSGQGGGSDPGTGSGSGQAEEPGSAPAQAVNSYEADGRTVKLTFWGGVCDKYKASAEESGKTVKITIRAKDPDSKKICVKMAKQQTVEVELDKDLGDRKVVDAQDGEAVPRAK
jgi:hypothetical protein